MNVGVQITKGSALTFKYTHNKPDFKELQFFSYSPMMTNFRMYVAKDAPPTSSNTIQIVPSWLAGYVADVIPGTKDACVGTCDYFILLESEVDIAVAYIMVKYEDIVSDLNPMFPLFSYIRSESTHCYSIEINELSKKENLIIGVNLFSGYVRISVNPWENLADKKKFLVSEYVYSEKYIELTPANRTLASSPGKDTGRVYICIEGFYASSYMLRAYPESQSEGMQRYNFLMNDVTIKGYMKSNSVTRYRVVDFAGNSNVTINMNVLLGNPKLYGFICNDITYCMFDKNKINQESKISNIIFRSKFD